MAINSNKAKETLDFEYEDEQCNISLKVKYHHTELYGPTVSLSENNGQYVGYPVKMFVEITDFLRQRKLVGGAVPVNNSSSDNLEEGLRPPEIVNEKKDVFNNVGSDPIATFNTSQVNRNEDKPEEASVSEELTDEQIMKERELAKAKANTQNKKLRRKE